MIDMYKTGTYPKIDAYNHFYFAKLTPYQKAAMVEITNNIAKA